MKDIAKEQITQISGGCYIDPRCLRIHLDIYDRMPGGKPPYCYPDFPRPFIYPEY